MRPPTPCATPDPAVQPPFHPPRPPMPSPLASPHPLRTGSVPPRTPIPSSPQLRAPTHPPGLLPSPCPAQPLLFPQAWAVYKGKYHEGTDKADPSTWKTRLRCALNKSTDFQEVPERSQLDISEPYKVYQIVCDGTRDAGTPCRAAVPPCVPHPMGITAPSPSSPSPRPLQSSRLCSGKVLCWGQDWAGFPHAVFGAQCFVPCSLQKKMRRMAECSPQPARTHR